MSQEYFSIALSSDLNLAISLDNMGEVIQTETQSICTIPGVADFWYGTINFKGSLLWVLDSNRYFDLANSTQGTQKKLTAVIIKQHREESSAKIALITTKLEGIISLPSELLKPLAEQEQVSLKDCCSAVAQYGNKRIFILNSTDFLQQLNQQSKLVFA